MHYLTLDTNTWIYLVNGIEPVKLLDFIIEEIKKDNIKIIVPQTVLDEWNSHKNKTVKQGTIQFYSEILDSLKRVSRLLGDDKKLSHIDFLFGDKESDKESFKDLIDKIKKNKEKVEEAIQKNIEKVESIFSNSNTVKLKISNRVRLEAGELALNKKPPFKEKNSFADALILLSFIKYVKEKNIKGAKFISYNTKDFCYKIEGKKLLHKELEILFKETESNFHTVIGEALSAIEKDIISKEEIEYIKEQQEILEQYSEPHTCQMCDGYKGTGNEIYFDEPFGIENESIKGVVPKNQLEFGFAADLPKKSTDDYTHTIQTGTCEYCGTLHIKCQACDEVTSVVESSELECSGCDLLYEINFNYDRKGVEYFDIKILDADMKNCESCGKRFKSTDFYPDICPECEESYNQ